MERRWPRRGARLLLVAAVFQTAGCVYFNGIYNAKEAARHGDARLREGAENDAAAFFQVSAAKAETVLVRHPKSSWRSRALYLAGRGEAWSGQCEAAAPRLTEYLASADAAANDKEIVRDRDRARLALAACDLRLSRIPSARLRLDSLVDAPDKEVASQARLWAARAALAAGDRNAVSRYLGAADPGVMGWELMLASLTAREYTRVESLLVARAERADYRDDVTRALREMWSAGYFDAVESIVRAYDAARIRDANRASMHFVVGELNLRSRNDSLARQHLFVARGLAGRDTVLERESAARLAYISMLRVSTLPEIDTIVARQDTLVRRAPFARRVGEQLLLVKLLAAQEEPTGASLFLAAEVARDSLHIVGLARELFLKVTRDVPASPLVPQALYAAGILEPDSAATWNQRIRTDYSGSAIAVWLSGNDPSSRPDFALAPELLQVRWNQTLRVWADSVRKLRAPPKAPVAAAKPFP